MFQQPNPTASKKSPVGVASSDFVDPETLPLQILHKEVHLDKNGKEQNGVDKKDSFVLPHSVLLLSDEDSEILLPENWQLRKNIGETTPARWKRRGTISRMGRTWPFFDL